MARVKTLTAKGCEVLLNGSRVTLKSMKDVQIIHRNDGYGYGYG
jgi:hypothetical protein